MTIQKFVAVPPVVISGTKLVSSTVPELGPSDPAAWVSGASYAVGNRVSRVETHRIYECIKATTDVVEPESAPLEWEEKEATQRWKMFDPLRTIPTTHDSPLIVEVAPGARADTWFIDGVSASSVTVTMTAGGVEIYSKTVTLSKRITQSWSDYFFGTFENAQTSIDIGMPAVAGAVIKFEFTSTSGVVSVGKVVVGPARVLGDTEEGAESDSENYSVVTRSNIDGTVTNIARRPVLDKTSQVVHYKSDEAVNVYNIRKLLSAEPGVWSAMGNQYDHEYFELFAVYGFYTRFKINADSKTHGSINIEIEEL